MKNTLNRPTYQHRVIPPVIPATRLSRTENDQLNSEPYSDFAGRPLRGPFKAIISILSNVKPWASANGGFFRRLMQRRTSGFGQGHRVAVTIGGASAIRR
jgi:hypothetical protein